MRSILPPPCSSAGVPSTVTCNTNAESQAQGGRGHHLRPGEASHLDTDGRRLRQALQGGLQPQGGCGSRLSDEVVPAGVTDAGQSIVLAEEGDAERAGALGGGRAPVGAEGRVQLVARLHGPGGARQLPTGEEAGHGVVRLALLVRQLGPAPDVAAQRAQPRRVQLHALARPLLQRFQRRQRGGGAALRQVLRPHEGAAGQP